MHFHFTESDQEGEPQEENLEGRHRSTLFSSQILKVRMIPVHTFFELIVDRVLFKATFNFNLFLRTKLFRDLVANQRK